MSKSNYEKYAEVKQQELLHKERNLLQAISCLRRRRKFASLQCIDSAIDFVADLYDLSIDEVKRAMDGEEYWCIWNSHLLVNGNNMKLERMINMAYILGRLISWNVKFEKVDSLTVRVYGNFDGFSVVRECKQDNYIEVDGRLMDYEDFEDWIYSIKI